MHIRKTVCADPEYFFDLGGGQNLGIRSDLVKLTTHLKTWLIGSRCNELAEKQRLLRIDDQPEFLDRKSVV